MSTRIIHGESKRRKEKGRGRVKKGARGLKRGQEREREEKIKDESKREGGAGKIRAGKKCVISDTGRCGNFLHFPLFNELDPLIGCACLCAHRTLASKSCKRFHGWEHAYEGIVTSGLSASAACIRAKGQVVCGGSDDA